MKVISQDGYVDLNYEQSTIYAYQQYSEIKIKAIIYDKVYVLGNYKSREQLLEVMRMIKESFINGKNIFEMPEDL